MAITKPFISVSSGAFIGHAQHVAFEEVAQIGGTHLELIFIHGFTDPFEEAYFCDSEAAKIRKLYADTGLTCGAFAAHMDMTKDNAVKEFIARMDFAKAIGSDFMITYAAPLHKERDFYTNMETFIKHAEDIDIIIAFENPGDGKRNIIEGGRSGAHVISRMNSPHVKFNYDFGNLMSQYREDVIPEEDILHIIENTVHLHMKDSRRVESGWEFPAVGDGDIAFTNIFNNVAPKCMDLPLCLEVPVTQVRDVYGVPKTVDVLPTLEDIRHTLSRSLNFARSLTAR